MSRILYYLPSPNPLIMIHNAPDELLTLLQENAPDSTLPVPALRQGFSDLYKEMQQESLSSCDYQIEKVPLRDGAVGHWITLPEVMSDRVLLFFHGGGFTLGSTDDHLGLCIRLARASRARVFSRWTIASRPNIPSRHR